MATDRARATDEQDALTAVNPPAPLAGPEADVAPAETAPTLPGAAPLAGAPPAGRGARPARVSALQRLQQTHGNRAVQRLLGAAPSTTAAPVTEEDLASRLNASGNGSALPDPVQRRLESGLGADLSGVRVHTDSEADHLSRAVDATAFTSGSDIYFRSGAYDPASSTGLHLLAHEAAHTLQQAAGPVSGEPGPGGLTVSDPEDAFERAADRAAAAAVSPPGAGAPAPRPAVPGGATAAIQRAPEGDTGDEGAAPQDAEAAPDPRVETAVEQIVRSLAGDPEDRSGGAHQLLNQVDPGLQQAVTTTLRSRLTPDQWVRLSQGGAAPAPQPAAVAGPEGAPVPAEQGAPAAVQRAVERKLPSWGSSINPASYMKFDPIYATMSGFDESGASVTSGLADFTTSPERAAMSLPTGTVRGFVRFRLMASWVEDNLLLDSLGHGLYQVSVPFSLVEGTLQWQTPLPEEQSTSGSGAALQLPVPVATGVAQRGGWATVTPAIVGTGSSSIGGSAGGSAGVPGASGTGSGTVTSTTNTTNTFTGSFTVSLAAPPLPEPVPLAPHLTFRVNRHQLIEGEEGRLSAWFRSQPAEVQSAIRSGQRPLQVSGYASTTNTLSYNRALAQRRANYVQDILRGFVGSQATISIFYFGEDAARTADRVEAAAERRCEVVIGASRAGAPPPTGAH